MLQNPVFTISQKCSMGFSSCDWLTSCTSAEIEIHQTNLHFCILQLSGFGEPVPTVPPFSSSWWTGVELGMVLCCCSPLMCIRRCFSPQLYRVLIWVLIVFLWAPNTLAILLPHRGILFSASFLVNSRECFAWKSWIAEILKYRQPIWHQQSCHSHNH